MNKKLMVALILLLVVEVLYFTVGFRCAMFFGVGIVLGGSPGTACNRDQKTLEKIKQKWREA